jgi:SOS-response transcriptional repressor LexA
MEKTLGQIILDAMKAKRLSAKKLSEISGVSRQYIGLIIKDSGHEVSISKRLALAKVLDIPNDVVLGLENKEYDAGKLIAERMGEMLKIAAKDVSGTISEIAEVVLLGYVPAGYPLPNEEEGLGKIKIPKDQLGSARDAKRLYALVVSGDSLIGDEIYPGFHVVINPDDKDLVLGKIYLVRVDNAVTIKKIALQDGRFVLRSSNEKYPDMTPSEGEILGRVVWDGIGRER